MSTFPFAQSQPEQVIVQVVNGRFDDSVYPPSLTGRMSPEEFQSSIAPFNGILKQHNIQRDIIRFIAICFAIGLVNIALFVILEWRFSAFTAYIRIYATVSTFLVVLIVAVYFVYKRNIYYRLMRMAISEVNQKTVINGLIWSHYRSAGGRGSRYLEYLSITMGPLSPVLN